MANEISGWENLSKTDRPAKANMTAEEKLKYGQDMGVLLNGTELSTFVRGFQSAGGQFMTEKDEYGKSLLVIQKPDGKLAKTEITPELREKLESNLSPTERNEAIAEGLTGLSAMSANQLYPGYRGAILHEQQAHDPLSPYINDKQAQALVDSDKVKITTDKTIAGAPVLKFESVDQNNPNSIQVFITPKVEEILNDPKVDKATKDALIIDNISGALRIDKVDGIAPGFSKENPKAFSRDQLSDLMSANFEAGMSAGQDLGQGMTR